MVYYPRELVDLKRTCPVCGASDMQKGHRMMYDSLMYRCRNFHCSGTREIEEVENS